MGKVLLVEDTPSLQLVYATVLQNAGHEVLAADNAAMGLELFEDHAPPVVLVDLMLPDRGGMELMTDFLTMRPEVRVVVITAHGSINKAVEAMRAGAHEFLVKPFDEARMLSAVDNALRDSAIARDRISPTSASAQVPRLIGRSPAMGQVYQKIRSVSGSMATVFISGESGTGKELCAQAIHDLSSRASKPFVPLNCGAIPPDLMESEVFGHLKGSFTGAIADKPGAAAAADGGTLFLDEVCEMAPNLQTKLLRFLQTSTIQPVGATMPQKVNVRILCATNRDPLTEVRRGRFREDLYYRLHVVPIHMPPLRERSQDVLEIARWALARFSEVEGKEFETLSREVEDLFLRLNWPGNVRQLLNVLRNVVVLNDGPLVTQDMLPADVHAEADNVTTLHPPRPANNAPSNLVGLIGKPFHEIERLVIEETISRMNGSVPKAARVLELSPSTIYRKREAWEKINKAAE